MSLPGIRIGIAQILIIAKERSTATEAISSQIGDCQNSYTKLILLIDFAITIK